MLQLGEMTWGWTFPTSRGMATPYKPSDNSVSAQRITEVTVSGMEVNIPHTFFIPHAKKPWFNHACSRAVKTREVVHKMYLSLPSLTNYNFHISERNRAKPTFRLSKNSFIDGKCQNNNNNSILPKTSGIYPRTFLTILLLRLSHL